ncbi:MAG: hypothetical protein R3A44_13870 [Caldilineaceae bacterium]
MNYLQPILEAQSDARALEVLYREARRQGATTAFAEAMQNAFAQLPDNLLLAAWRYRLEEDRQDAATGGAQKWRTALWISLISGVLFWTLSDFDHQQVLDHIPTLILAWAPISAIFVMAFLALSTGRHFGRAGLLAGGAAAAFGYVYFLAPQLANQTYREHYLDLAAGHLPLMAWAAVGSFLLWRATDVDSSARNRFAFLIKSLEIMITGGLFAMAGGVFTGITIGMFEALGIQLTETVIRILVGGGAGVIPVLAVVAMYDPDAPPVAQAFAHGLSGLISTLMRLLLPLTFVVGLIYVAFIPFNFMQPFLDRDVLAVYNAMLFAVMALLIGVTPVHSSGLSPQLERWLRRTLLAVAVLALLVSLYATAAIIYRTLGGGFTPNRLTVLGWNLVNMAILGYLLFKQRQTPAAQWVPAMHQVISWGANLYVAWGVVVIVVLPWLF